MPSFPEVQRFPVKITNARWGYQLLQVNTARHSWEAQRPNSSIRESTFSEIARNSLFVEVHAPASKHLVRSSLLSAAPKLAGALGAMSIWPCTKSVPSRSIRFMSSKRFNPRPPPQWSSRGPRPALFVRGSCSCHSTTSWTDSLAPSSYPYRTFP